MNRSGVQVEVVGEIRQVGEAPDLGLPVFVAAGRSNVGKSTILNRLLGRHRLLRTSRTPGCTRTIQLVAVRAPDGAFVLADLPGYGYAALSKERRDAWGPLIEGFLRRCRRLAGVLVLVDVRRGPEREEELLLEFVRGLRITPIVVLTKCDKLRRSEAKLAIDRMRSRFAPLRTIAVSGVTGEGIDLLWNCVVERLAPPAAGGV